MKRKLLRQTLNEWRANVWLIVEMIIVSAIVWYINDYLYVHVATRLEPTGFDTSHTYMAEFRYLPEGSRRYTDYGEATTERNRADLLSIIEAIRQRSTWRRSACRQTPSHISRISTEWGST